MYHSDAKFHRFGGFGRKHNVVQFKIRDKTSPSIIGINNTKPTRATEAEPTTSSSSSSSSSIDPFDFPPVIKRTPLPTTKLEEEEEEEEDNVFDYPDIAQEALEVKLMVASMRSIPHNDKKKKKVSPVSTPKSLSTTTNMKKPVTKVAALNKRAPPPAPPLKTVHNMDRQEACYSPQLKQQLIEQQQQRDQLLLKQKKERILLEQQIERALQQQAKEQERQQEASFDIFDFDYNPTIRPSRVKTGKATLLPEKKRKRNVVAHLKTARGETTQPSKSFDFLSDGEEEEVVVSHLLPLRETKERSRSPELTYAERMELELEAMTQVTNEPMIPACESKRVAYTPQNKLNVKITFASSSKK
ncbi:hypothetical protein INT47_003717 [Mucor saturninus]|uniref:Uncharacterized protein n=1 Tax=Mucor saturninus TaxID=64648 RepID=A0A8H7RAM2_9FUNG|nr:hypothetical protein INT47_003717 [Mucor saturninus]